MTVTTTVRTAGPYLGTGAVSVYAFAFKVFLTTDVLVQITSATGVLSMGVLGTDYSVSLNTNQNGNPGGSVVLTSNLASGASLTIGSSVPLTQSVVLTNPGGFYPQVISDALDKVTILIQQALSSISGALRIPEIGSAQILPPAAQRANQLLSFDANGNPVTIAAAAQSATALTVALANTTTNLQGAGLVGFNPALTYAPTTVGAAIAQFLTSTAADILFWMASGVGAISRSIGDRLRDTIHAKDYGAKLDGLTFTDGAMTSGQATLMSASAPFKLTDIGKVISISGAGLASATLTTTISGYTNASTVTLGAVASTTVTGKTFDFATDDTAALQAALNALPIGGLLRVNGRARFTTVTASTYKGKIADGELNGTLRITSPGTTGQSSYFDVERISFEPPAADNTLDCIVLQNMAYGGIYKCKFRGVNTCVSVPANAGQTYFQDVNRITVEGCQYDFANYFVKSVYTGSTGNYGLGDWTIRGNTGNVLINTINMQKCDGLILTHNTCFMPLVQATKLHHVVMTSSVYLNISDNEFFEAGGDCVNLTDCLYVTGKGNTHAYPGQYVSGGAWNLQYPGGVPTLNVNTISGEKIIRPSTYGINLGANARNFNITGNAITQPGSNDHAQVGPTQSALGIVENASTIDLVCTGNAVYGGTYTFVDGTRNVARNNYYESIGNVGVTFDRMRSIDVGGATNPVIDDKDEIQYSQSVGIVGFTNGVVGSAYKDISVRFTVNSCVLTNSATLVLKGGTNAAPPVDAIMVFKVLEGGKAIEKSRNF